MGFFDFLRRAFSKHETREKPAISAASSKDRRIIHERLPMTQFDSIGVPEFDAALSFWFDNHRDGEVPDWSCFRPEKHPLLLPHILLYEKIDGRFFNRIVGDAMQPYLPHKPMGKFLDEIAPRDRVDDVTMRLERTLTDGLPNYVEKERLWKEGIHSFGYNALSMPFLSESTGIPRVLCIVQVRSTIADQ